jgi:hypothetical protein
VKSFVIAFVATAALAVFGAWALAAGLPSHSYVYTLGDGSTLKVVITASSNGYRSSGHIPQAKAVTWDTPSGQVTAVLTPTYTPAPPPSTSSSTTTSPTTTSSSTSTTATSTTATSSTSSGGLSPTQPTDVTSWINPGTYKPAMSDQQAALQVTLTTEAVPANTAANDYVPTASELAAFHSATQFNPLTQYVDGLDGISNPSTDDLIQWASHKWGIPTSWIRAQIRQESDWRQSQLGDELSVSPALYAQYPAAEQTTGDQVYTSMSLAQIKWEAGVTNLPGQGAPYVRIESSAFALDLYASYLRYYYDGGPSDWLVGTQPAGDAWDSVGDWFEPGSPSAHASYVSEVQAHLTAQDWPWSAPIG